MTPAMAFPASVAHTMRNCLRFSGRSPPAECWWFLLLVCLASSAAGLAIGFIGLANGAATVREALAPAWALLTVNLLSSASVLLPASLRVRRLHDAGQSGWWSLLFLLPVAGDILALALNFWRGTDGPNRFGPAPGSGRARPGRSQKPGDDG